MRNFQTNKPGPVPVAEIYPAISGNFHIAYTNGTGQSSIKVTPAHSGVEAGRVAVLAELVILKVGWISSEMAVALRFKMCGLETMPTTRRNGQGPDSSLKSP